jgi:hypothetical protein
LTLFDGDSSRFLPRIFMYFDDIVGDDTWLCNEFTGQRLAIEEFNQQHASKKICKDYFVSKKYPDSWWADLIYIYHDFAHPRYNDFVADKEQMAHEAGIRLR